MATLTQSAGKAPTASKGPITAKSEGQWQMIWRRLRRNKLAMGGLIVLILFVFMGVGAPLLTRQDPTEFNLGKDQLPPVWVAESPAKLKPNPEYIFGTDSAGRDVFSRMVYGARTSVFVGLIPTTIIMLIGMIAGMSSGFFGGALDNVLIASWTCWKRFPTSCSIVLTVALRETALGMRQMALLLFCPGGCFLGRDCAWCEVDQQVTQPRFVDAARHGRLQRLRIFKHILPKLWASSWFGRLWRCPA
jgi:oligopeptide transport system permease protein